jgi:hypothetical protein
MPKKDIPQQKNQDQSKLDKFRLYFEFVEFDSSTKKH